MVRLKRLVGALTALGLAIGASSAGAFWNFGGGGGFGGDNIWSPFDARFLIDPDPGEGEDEGSFMIFTKTDGSTGLFGSGSLFIQLDLDGYAFNTGDYLPDVVNPVDEGTPLGDFLLTVTYQGAEFINLGDGQGQLVVPNNGENSGFGELVYIQDRLLSRPDGSEDPPPDGFFYIDDFLVNAGPPNGNPNNVSPENDLSTEQNSVDGELQGDSITVRTPVCVQFDERSELGGEACADNFFEWIGPIASGPLLASDVVGIALLTELDPGTTAEKIGGPLSLIHGGLPCKEDGTLLDAFYCNPTPETFAEIPADQKPADTYADFVLARRAAITAEAQFLGLDGSIDGLDPATASTLPLNENPGAWLPRIPVPPVAALFGIGLAGIVLTRRRARRR
jgi:hypothetical protein